MQFFRELANTFVQIEWPLVRGALCLGDKGSPGIKGVGKKSGNSLQVYFSARM